MSSLLRGLAAFEFQQQFSAVQLTSGLFAVVQCACSYNSHLYYYTVVNLPAETVLILLQVQSVKLLSATFVLLGTICCLG